MPLVPRDGLLLVEVAIDGQPARMALDTGAQRSVLSTQAVARLRLALDEVAGTPLRGIGGIEHRRNALPRSVAIGGLPLVRRSPARDISLAVGTLHGGLDGLLGRDFLAAFDLVLDMPDRSLALYEIQGCSGAFLPPPYVRLRGEAPLDAALVLEAELDGVPLRAQLDTGAGRSTVTAPGMIRLGLTSERIADDQVTMLRGFGPNMVAARLRRFARLRVGPATLDAPLLALVPVRLPPYPDLLLGTDFLAGRRLWISFTTRQVFLAHP